MCACTEMRQSPRDTACKYCGKVLTRKGCAEHEHHACRKNPKRRKRSFGKVRCVHCGKDIYETGLRVHVATQHPEAYARSPSVKAHRARASKRTSPEGARREPQVASMSNHAPRKASEAGKDRQARNEHIWRAVQAQSAKTIETKARPSHKI